MNGGPPKPESYTGSCDAQAMQYSKGLENGSGQIASLFRLTTVLHGLTDLGAIASTLLSALITENGLGFDRAVLMLLDHRRELLRGCDAAGPRERELTRDFWKTVDRFPDSLSDAVRMTVDPRRRMRSSLSKKARRLLFDLSNQANPAVLAVLQGSAVDTGVRGLADPPDLINALGEGPWSWWPVVGAQGTAGVLGVAGGYAQPLPDSVRDPLLILSRHAGLSIERGQAYQSLERQVAEMTTVQEVSRGILSATNLEDLLNLISAVASRVMQARWAVTWLTDSEEDHLRVASHCGFDPNEEELLPKLLPLANRAVETRRPVRVEDAGADGTLPPGSRRGTRSVLLVPLVAFGRNLGVLGVGDREMPGSPEGEFFLDEDEQFLAVLGAQAALAIKNAHLFEQVREAERRLRETQGLLLQTEKLAALGEMSAKVAHEIRNPLSAVGGFARRILRNLPQDDPNAEHASVIVREIGRLEGILAEQLEFARLSRPRLMMIDLTEVVQETLQLTRDEVERRGVELMEDYGHDLPRVLLDRDKVKQVLLNILQNALGAVRDGNRIRVRVNRVGSNLCVEIANDGEPIPGEILDNLFVPFATTKADGTGLGLAVAHQIVKEHGGEIQVRTGDPWSVIFTVSFPIRENQDRRRNLVERRKGRDRRRAA